MVREREEIGKDSRIFTSGSDVFRSGTGRMAFDHPVAIRSQAVPSKRLIWLFALGIPLNAIMYAIDQSWFFLVYNFLLILAAVVSYLIQPKNYELVITRQMDAALSVRVANKIVLFIENEGAMPFEAIVRDECPQSFESGPRQWRVSLEPGQKKRFEYEITPPERGAESFPGTFVRIQCLFGLVEKQLLLNTKQPCRVYPNILALRQFNLLNQSGRLREIGIRQARMRGIGTDFESLRDYAEGDDFRKIDWKASARRSKLIVRQYEVERNQSVLLCVDCGRHMLSEVNGVRKLDHVLDSILLLANAASAAGDQVGLLVYSEAIQTYIPPKKGKAQIGLVIEAIHDLVAEPLESDPVSAFAYLGKRHKKRSLIVNFTVAEEKDRAADVVNSFGILARQNIGLLVNVSDPRIKEYSEAPLESLEDIAGLRAAQWVTEEKNQAESMLRGAGIHLLDSEPQDLGRALVNYYLDVKARALL